MAKHLKKDRHCCKKNRVGPRKTATFCKMAEPDEDEEDAMNLFAKMMESSVAVLCLAAQFVFIEEEIEGQYVLFSEIRLKVEHIRVAMLKVENSFRPALTLHTVCRAL